MDGVPAVPTMRSPILPLLLLFLALPAGDRLAAQERGSGIQRCESPNGTQVYTDQDCDAFDARPAPVDGELMMRLASDGGAAPEPVALAMSAAAPATGSLAHSLDGAAARSTAGRQEGHAPRPPGCARSTSDLVTALRAAWQAGDVNTLAASYNWAGSGTRQATSTMSRLENLVGQPLLDVRHYGVGGGGAMQLASLAGGSGPDLVQVQLGSGTRPRLHDFRVTTVAGCHFVQF